MSNTQSIYLVLLCGALLGAIAFAYRGLKQLQAQGEKVPRQQRLAVKLSLTAATFMLLGAGGMLLATLQGETGNWNVFLVIFSSAVAATWSSGTIARLYASARSV